MARTCAPTKMVKIKLSEATDTQLDWLVAKCEGVDVSEGLTDDERYSTNPALMQPIMEREGIATCKPNSKGWLAHNYLFGHYISGRTMLIAAARCYVAGKMGLIVEVPEELA